MSSARATSRSTTPGGGGAKRRAGPKRRALAAAKERAKTAETSLAVVRDELAEERRRADTLALRVQTLMADNAGLRSKLENDAATQLKVEKGLNIQLTTERKRVKDLKKQLLTMRGEFDAERNRVVHEYAASLQETNNRLSAALLEIETRNEEREAIEKWRRVRERMSQELANLQKDLLDSQNTYKEDLLEMKRTHQIDRREWDKAKQAELDQVRSEAELRAQHNMDITMRNIIKRNEDLDRARLVHERKAQELQKLNKLYVKDNKKLKRDEEISLQMHQEHAKKAQRLSKQNKEMRQKVSSLEAALASIVREFDKEREVILAQTGTELEERRLEVDGLRRLLAVKNKELAHIKRLAQAVLEQRSELEQFFLDSLQHVKREMDKEQRHAATARRKAYQAQMRRAARGQGPYPEIRPDGPGVASKAATSNSGLGLTLPRHRVRRQGDTFITEVPVTTLERRHARTPPPGSAASSPRSLRGSANGAASSVVSEMLSAAGSGGSSIDIADLTWEDRERVLRVLFAKMNGLSVPDLDSSSFLNSSAVSGGVGGGGSGEGGDLNLSMSSRGRTDRSYTGSTASEESPAAQRRGGSPRHVGGSGLSIGADDLRTLVSNVGSFVDVVDEADNGGPNGDVTGAADPVGGDPLSRPSAWLVRGNAVGSET